VNPPHQIRANRLMDRPMPRDTVHWRELRSADCDREMRLSAAIIPGMARVFVAVVHDLKLFGLERLRQAITNFISNGHIPVNPLQSHEQWSKLSPPSRKGKHYGNTSPV
jgi:hypothetical protein